MPTEYKEKDYFKWFVSLEEANDAIPTIKAMKNVVLDSVKSGEDTSLRPTVKRRFYVEYTKRTKKVKKRMFGIRFWGT